MMDHLVLGEINERGEYVFADGTPVRRLTRERRADLDYRWFGTVPPTAPQPQQPVVSQPKPLLKRVACVCDWCGQSFRLTESQRAARQRMRRDGKLLCSSICSRQESDERAKAERRRAKVERQQQRATHAIG